MPPTTRSPRFTWVSEGKPFRRLLLTSKAIGFQVFFFASHDAPPEKASEIRGRGIVHASAPKCMRNGWRLRPPYANRIGLRDQMRNCSCSDSIVYMRILKQHTDAWTVSPAYERRENGISAGPASHIEIQIAMRKITPVLAITAQSEQSLPAQSLIATKVSHHPIPEESSNGLRKARAPREIIRIGTTQRIAQHTMNWSDARGSSGSINNNEHRDSQKNPVACVAHG